MQGSDLDPATKQVIEKGSRNVEILKQAQYSPMHVSKQIAIIFCGTRNLLRNIPTRSVGTFEIEFLHQMETMHKGVLDNLGKGLLPDEDLKILEQTARDVSKKYEDKK